MEHYPTRPVDRDKAEHDLALNIKKATSPEETAPKQKHVRSWFLFHFSESKNFSLTRKITFYHLK